MLQANDVRKFKSFLSFVKRADHKVKTLLPHFFLPSAQDVSEELASISYIRTGDYFFEKMKSGNWQVFKFPMMTCQMVLCNKPSRYH